MQPTNVGEIFEYNGVYHIVLDIVLMKHPVSKEWMQGYMFKPADGRPDSAGTPNIFVQESIEFCEKFRWIRPGGEEYIKGEAIGAKDVKKLLQSQEGIRRK